MIKKRYIIIAVIVILAILGAAWYLGRAAEQRTQKELVTKSKEFVKKWGNFKDESSDEYLSSIKPYISGQLYNDYQESTQELKGSKAEGVKGAESYFIIKTDPEIKKVDKTYETTVRGQRSYAGEEKYDQVVTLTWQKQDNDYVITDLYTDK